MELPTRYITANRTSLRGKAMFDNCQSTVLDLENLSFGSVVRGNLSERCAALSALVRLMNDNSLRRGDLPQSHALLTDPSADL